MHDEIRRRFEDLRTTFDREPWHGPSIDDVLHELTAQDAFRRPIENAHSIWELVLHMTYWRRAAILALRGESIAAFQPNTPEDWLSPETADEDAWQEALQGLEDSQVDLLKTIEGLDASDLERRVEGRDYSFDVVITGILQHDVYHAGQISLLRKL